MKGVRSRHLSAAAAGVVLVVLSAVGPIRAGAEEPASAIVVYVYTRDRRILEGTTDRITFSIDGPQGKADIRLANGAEIHFEGAEVSVQRHDGTVVRGRGAPTTWKLKAPHSEVEVKAENILLVYVPPSPRLWRLAAPWEVSVAAYTRDRNSLVGFTETTAFTLDGPAGRTDVRLVDTTEIQFDGDGVSVRMKDGTILQGKGGTATWKVKTRLAEIEVKTENILALHALTSVFGVRPPAPWDAAAARGLAATGEGPAVPPLRTLDRTACVRSLLLAPDGTMLYALDAQRAQLLVIDTESLAVRKDIPVHQGTEAMAISPDGANAYLVGNSGITVVDLRTGKVGNPFDLATPGGSRLRLVDVLVCDAQTVYVGADGGLLRFSAPKRTVDWSTDRAGGCVRAVPGRAELYLQAGGKVVLPGAVEKGKVSAPQLVPYEYCAPAHPFVVTPDGKYAVVVTGTVLRLGRSFLADPAPCGRVEPHLAAITLSDAGRLLLFTASGAFKEYNLDTIEAVRTQTLGVQVHAAVADEKKKRMYLFGATAKAVAGTAAAAQPYYTPYRAYVPGTLYAYDLPAAP